MADFSEGSTKKTLEEIIAALVDEKVAISSKLNLLQAQVAGIEPLLVNLMLAWNQTVAREMEMELEQVFVKPELDDIARDFASNPELARFAEFFFRKGYLSGRKYAVELKPMADKYNL